MIRLPTETDLTTIATLLATSLSYFHSTAIKKGGLALPGGEKCKSCYLCLVCRPRRRIVITIRIRRSAKYWEKVDKKAQGPEMNFCVGWRVRFTFDKESKGEGAEVLRVGEEWASVEVG